MNDNPESTGFLSAFERLTTFYDGLDYLCRERIPQQLGPALSSLMGREVTAEVLDQSWKPNKPTKLGSTTNVKLCAKLGLSKYLPNPVVVRLRCDGRHVLLAALLSPDLAPEEGPALLIALLDAGKGSDDKLADLTVQIARNRPRDESGSFLVPLDEFSRAKVDYDDKKLGMVIDERIAPRLHGLLMGHERESTAGQESA
jgi:hypothetical protein